MSLTPTAGEAKKRVCYFFDSDIGNYHYGPGHPMKPTRIRMCHSLVMNYGLYKKMEIFRAKPATKREMSQFHSDEYVEFLARITPENMQMFGREQGKYNVGDDCPVFDGLFEYCSISAGGSMEGAARLSRDKCDIAINWAGGLHHAKKAEASGFCYINDIVLGILELLRYHKRVLYIDIDVHHGDGVEEAFYTTDRVMTVSLHKYGEFFPGTGELRDRGMGKGKGYAVNVPLHDGITDSSYASIFQPVIQRVIEWYQPNAIVLQCGSDSLSGDKLGPFNLSMKGHAECVRFVKSFQLPLLLLGGGGYTMRNVARAWCYETGLAAGVELGHTLPINEYFSYFGPDYELDVRASNAPDLNTPEYLNKLKMAIFEQMRDTDFAPSVQINSVPTLAHDHEDDNENEDMEDPDDRKNQRIQDQRIAPETELSDSEDEGTGDRRDRRSHRSSPSANGTSNGKGKGRASPRPEFPPAAASNGTETATSTFPIPDLPPPAPTPIAAAAPTPAVAPTPIIPVPEVAQAPIPPPVAVAEAAPAPTPMEVEPPAPAPIVAAAAPPPPPPPPAVEEAPLPIPTAQPSSSSETPASADAEPKNTSPLKITIKLKTGSLGTSEHGGSTSGAATNEDAVVGLPEEKVVMEDVEMADAELEGEDQVGAGV